MRKVEDVLLLLVKLWRVGKGSAEGRGEVGAVYIGAVCLQHDSFAKASVTMLCFPFLVFKGVSG